ncbi:MAG: hypothetical protein HQL71_13730 [Magnetococcales bacterium]|nr:hypothetical protein [Magnetococcales bacterium]
MRIFLQILLGAVAIAALLHGLRKLWQSRKGGNGFGDVANDSDYIDDGQRQPLNEDFSSWVKSTNGRLTIIILTISLFLMAVDRIISVGDKIPVDYTPVPQQTSVVNK